MKERLRALEKATEVALSAGVVMSGLLLLVGLAAGSGPALRAAVILLMATPVVRVVILTLGLLHERDWAFAAVSFFVLAVLASGILVAFRM